MKYFIKRYPDGGFEFSPVGLAEVARDGFEIVDELSADIKAKLPQPGTAANELDAIKKRLEALEAKVK
jgi:hypothetical protein